METATLSQKIYIESISLQRGEFLTVYANGKQIELRVTPTGRIEIYSDDVREIMSFAEWYLIS